MAPINAFLDPRSGKDTLLPLPVHAFYRLRRHDAQRVREHSRLEVAGVHEHLTVNVCRDFLGEIYLDLPRAGRMHLGTLRERTPQC
jgi:hypothetical protein